MANLISQLYGGLLPASACPGEIEPFKDHLSACGSLTSLSIAKAARATFSINNNPSVNMYGGEKCQFFSHFYTNLKLHADAK